MSEWISLIALLFRIFKWFKEHEETKEPTVRAEVWEAFDEAAGKDLAPQEVLVAICQKVDGFGEALSEVEQA